MIVVDACVAVKWVLNEPHSAEALALLGPGPALAAPELIRVEVSNAILRACRHGRVSEAVARKALREWNRILAQGIELIPTDALFDDAINLAFALMHPLPDCIYLALARAEDAFLVTADKTLRERAAAARHRVRLLSDAT